MKKESEVRAPTGGAKERLRGARPLRACARWAAALCAAALTLALVAAGGVYLRLNSGPIDLSAYLPEIRSALSRQLPGVDFTFGRAAIALDPNGGGAVVEIEEIVLSDDETGPFARVPKATGAFRLWDLARGEVDPSNVTLTGISGRLVRDEDGAFRFGFGGLNDSDSGDGVEAFRRLLNAATDSQNDAASSGASSGTASGAASGKEITAAGQTLRLRDASILYVDALSHRAYRAEDADLTFWRARSGVYAGADVTLIGGRHGPVRARFTGRRAESGDVSVRGSFENAAPRDIADQIQALDWLEAFDAPVSGDINVVFTSTGRLLALSGGFAGGAGRLTLGENEVEPVTSTRLTYSYEPENERFVIEEASIVSPRATVGGAGFVQVNRDAEGEPRDIVAQLEFADIRVEAPELLDAPLTYQSGQATGRITLDPLVVEIGELRLNRDRMRLASTGRIWIEPEGNRADLTFRAVDFSLQEMLAHWPRAAAPGALEWMSANMETAHVIEADAIIRLGGETDEVKIDFQFEDAVGHYLRPMPPIRGGAGSGQVDLKRFTLSLDEGSAAPEGGAPVALAGSSFVIADLEHPDTPGEATIVATGAAADALAIIDHEPLSLVSKLGAPLGDVAGTVEVRAVAGFPLLKALLLEDVQASAQAAFADVALVAPGLGRTVTAKRLDMTADTTAFALSGDVVAAGTPAKVRWTERFSPSTREIEVAARVTPKNLASFGVEQDWFADGAAPVKARIDFDAARTRFDLTADLSPGAFAIPEIGWTKAPGAAGSLKAEGAIAGGRITLDAFTLDAGDLQVAGSAATDAAGSPVSAALSRLRYRGGVDLAVAARKDNKRWVVDAEGPLLDITKFDDLVDGALDGRKAGGDDGARFRINMNIGEVRVAEDQFFRNVRGFVRRTERRGLQAKIDGDVLGGAPVVLKFDREAEGGQVTLRADDAGRFLRDAGVFDDGAGGVLRVVARIQPGDAFRLKGDAKVENIVIHEDAKLEGLLNGAALDDLRKKMRDDGIVFDKIRAPFVYGDDRVVLTEAVAEGPAIGVNISGVYGLEDEQLDFDGVFTPLYGLNKAIGKIPLVGQILTGGEGQGVFAFTFNVKGAADDPSISVNPLSVLTPGVFRKIFSASGGQVAKEPSDPIDRADRTDR